MIRIDRNELLKRIGYSQTAIEIVEKELNLGDLENPTDQITTESDCGDVMFLYLNTRDTTIIDAKFNYIGCLGLQLAAPVITKIVKDLNVEQAAGLDSNDVIECVGKIPDHKMDCVNFALDTLKKALDKYNEREPFMVQN